MILIIENCFHVLNARHTYIFMDMKGMGIHKGTLQSSWLVHTCFVSHSNSRVTWNLWINKEQKRIHLVNHQSRQFVFQWCSIVFCGKSYRFCHSNIQLTIKSTRNRQAICRAYVYSGYGKSLSFDIHSTQKQYRPFLDQPFNNQWQFTTHFQSTIFVQMSLEVLDLDFV